MGKEKPKKDDWQSFKIDSIVWKYGWWNIESAESKGFKIDSIVWKFEDYTR